MLRREKLIRTLSRKGNQICAQPRSIPHPRAGKLIALLTPTPLDRLSPTTTLAYREIERHLHSAGYEMDSLVEPRLRGFGLGRRLGSLVKQHPAACWLLCSVPADVQRWFMKQKVPTLVAATCHPGIELPFFDLDYRAVCRHAAQVFLRLGHRRIAYLTARSDFAGDSFAEKGFREALETSTPRDALPRIVFHDGTPAGVQSVLRQMWKGRHPPTALLISKSEHALTAASHLIREGVRLPADVSLISRDNDALLDHFTPSIARYVYDGSAYARRFSRALIRLAREGSLKARRSQVMPHFVRGETLAPAPRT